MIIKASERGQALILITLAAIGLFAFAALAIDSSRAYSNKRKAQNAADTAALAGALSYAREGKTDNIETIALTRAKSNGFENLAGDPSTVVTVTITDVPNPADCPGKAKGKDITVTIQSYIHATFAKIIGREILASGATATARACGFKFVPWFDGNAIVGLKPTGGNCGFDTGNGDAEWKVEGGGIFSNGCAHSKKSSSVTFLTPGTCASTPGGVGAGTWSCLPQQGTAYDWNNYVKENMPPSPCDNTPGDVGITPSGGQTEFKDGVYCISDMDDFTKKNVTLDNATLYVTDKQFSLRYSGSGGLFGTPTRAGSYPGSDDYDGYYMVVEPISNNPNDFCSKPSDNHSQVLEWKGNGEGTFYGTILAPSACLDLRGNGDANGMHSQIIGWIVGSNGTADVYVNYKAEENHQIPISPNISILE